MATIELPRTAPTPISPAPPPAAEELTLPPAQALPDTPSWDGTIDVPPPDVLPPSVAPHDDDATGPTSTVLMMLGCGIWPFVVILAGLALIVPFLAGLIVVGVVGAVVFVPYWLVRRWRSGRHADEPAA